jgi:antitoxin component YwqK of YwqJK toxin-antitoxin module
MRDKPPRVDADDLWFNPASYTYTYQGKRFTGEMCEYDNEGRVGEIVELVDGVGHGISRTYYPDGRLHSKTRYEYGRPVGVGRIWYPNGRLQQEISYTDNA